MTWSMLLPIVACWSLGKVLAYAFTSPNSFAGQRIYAGAIVALIAVLAMANMRGFYWDIFGRGDGFFTANRITANLAFVAALFGGMITNGRLARVTGRE